MTGYYTQDDMIHEVDLREELDECIAELDSDDAEYACGEDWIDAAGVTGPAGEAFLADLAQEPDAFL